MRISPVRAELFHEDGRTDRQTDRRADRQTDMKKLMVVFRSLRSLKIYMFMYNFICVFFYTFCVTKNILATEKKIFKNALQN